MYLNEAREIIDAPHIAMFRIGKNSEGHAYIEAEHSFTHKDVLLLKKIFQLSSDLMDNQISLLFLPIPRIKKVDGNYLNNSLDDKDELAKLPPVI